MLKFWYADSDILKVRHCFIKWVLVYFLNKKIMIKNGEPETVLKKVTFHYYTEMFLDSHSNL